MIMAMAMPPPLMGGFSLRVQLFSPNAHTLSDKPVRAFRVVISPDVTIRDFCQEASRIHQINYGEPIAIKKCQDDQEFDVTQSEVVGALFSNASTIRVIQASASPSIRDSVPPNSALRFDPNLNLNRKREREGRAQTNGTPLNGWEINKRQRVSDLDPDHPIPSRETDFEVGVAVQQPRREILPGSEGSNVNHGNGDSRDVRASIPETPPPESSPNPSTDKLPYKSPFVRLHETAQQAIAGRENPSARSQNSNPPGAKSASFHIQRMTERGTSVSTAATSSLSGDLQSVQNEPRSTTKRNVSISFANKFNGSRSRNEDSIYENIESDSEGSATITKNTKAALKIKSSPHNGLPGLEWGSRFNTPPNGTRRNSRPREQASCELPLTPSSKEREERQRQRKEAEAARETRKIAADAAEKRQRGADDAREAEEAQRAEGERLRRQEEDRNAREKRTAVIIKAARLEKERLEKLESEKRLEEERNAEQSRLEQARLKKEIEQTARLEREKAAKLEMARQDAERVEREKAKAAEAARLREAKEMERVQREAVEAEEAKKSQEREKAKALKRKSTSAEPSEHVKSITPAKQTPIRPQSSTPFIPSGRKSAMKSCISSSQSGSSPLLTRTSPSRLSTDVGTDRPLLNGSWSSKDRRVSFDLSNTPNRAETPIRPGARASTTPKAQTPKPAPKLTNTSSVPPKQTPILPPFSISRLARERSASSTPQRQIVPPQEVVKVPASCGRILPPASRLTPQVAIKSASPSASSLRNRATPAGSRASKEKSMPAGPQVEISSDESGSDEDIPSKTQVVTLLNNTLRPRKPSPVPDIKRKLAVEKDSGGEDIEMESNQSSSPEPESRSPVIFNRTPPGAVPVLSPLPEPTAAIGYDSTQSGTDSMSGDENHLDSSDSRSGQEDDAEEDEDATIQIPKSSTDLPRSRPVAKTILESNKAASQKSSQIRKMIPTTLHSSDSGNSTQDEVDFQLTSSLYEARSQPSQPGKATPIIPSSQLSRPGLGASLQFLNEKKTTFTSSKESSQGNGAKAAARNRREQEDSSEEDSSDSEISDSDSDGPSAQLVLQQSESRSQENSTSDSETSSDDESRRESDDDDAMHAARNDLVAHVAKSKKANEDSQSSAKPQKSKSSFNPSARGSKGKFISRESPQIRNAGRELKRKSSDKYLTGYSFSQPQL